MFALTGTDCFQDLYRLDKAIGHPGSYGKVHIAFCRQSGQSLAVKIMKKPVHEASRYDKARASMIRSEEAIMRSIRHPHVVEVVDVIDTASRLYVIMKECRGGDLFDRIMDYDGKIPEAAAIGIFRHLLHAVGYIHEQRIVHGDLKLSNIMFDDGSDDSLRVIDFGLSQYRLDGSAPLTEMVGTPNYQSPDVILGSYSFEADLWSLGVILFVMVFGFNPFDPFGVTDDSETIHRRVLAGFDPVTKPGYGAFFPADLPASPEVKDLIAAMLQSNARLRIGLGDVLAHPWMQKGAATAAKTVVPKPIVDDTTSVAPCA